MTIHRTLREWEKLPYGDGSDQISDRLAERLAQLAAASPLSGEGGSGILEHGRHALRARGVVGVLATEECSLEILPKIDVDQPGNRETENRDIRRKLVHMLAVVLDLAIDDGSLADLDWQCETLLEILIRLFCDKLTDAVRQGMPRRYFTREDDLPALRGALDIPRQFTHHAVNPSRLACRFDELTENIPLNQAIKAAVSHLVRISRSPENQKRLRGLLFAYADIDDRAPSALAWDRIVIDRTNQRWRELLRMARLFLESRYQTTSSGGERGTALLFEMSALFEEYVGRMLVRALSGTGMTVKLQSGHRYCLNEEGTQRSLFLTRPDILIKTGAVVTHVVDTKWKRISNRIDDPKRGVSQADVYQMMAYGQLYRSPQLMLLYPHHRAAGTTAGIQGRHRINGQDAMLSIATIDLGDLRTIGQRLSALVTQASVYDDQGDEHRSHLRVPVGEMC